MQHNSLALIACSLVQLRSFVTCVLCPRRGMKPVSNFETQTNSVCSGFWLRFLMHSATTAIKKDGMKTCALYWISCLDSCASGADAILVGVITMSWPEGCPGQYCLRSRLHEKTGVLIIRAIGSVNAMQFLMHQCKLKKKQSVRDCNVYGVQCVRDVYFGGLCARKASVYLSKRINSSLLTKIFNN